MSGRQDNMDANKAVYFIELAGEYKSEAQELVRGIKDQALREKLQDKLDKI